MFFLNQDLTFRSDTNYVLLVYYRLVSIIYHIYIYICKGILPGTATTSDTGSQSVKPLPTLTEAREDNEIDDVSEGSI